MKSSTPSSRRTSKTLKSKTTTKSNMRTLWGNSPTKSTSAKIVKKNCTRKSMTLESERKKSTIKPFPRLSSSISEVNWQNFLRKKFKPNTFRRPSTNGKCSWIRKCQKIKSKSTLSSTEFRKRWQTVLPPTLQTSWIWIMGRKRMFKLMTYYFLWMLFPTGIICTALAVFISCNSRFRKKEYPIKWNP